MKNVGQPERATQNRVLALFRDELGYRYLGDWSDREGNSNVEESLLSAWLTRSGNTPVQINAALYKLRTESCPRSRSTAPRKSPSHPLPLCTPRQKPPRLALY